MTHRCDFDLSQHQDHLDELKKTAESPDLWNDRNHAQNVMKEISKLEGVINTWQSLELKLSEIQALLSLVDEAPTDERDLLQDELNVDLDVINKEFELLELGLILGDEYDDRNVVFSIHAGAGGTEAQDWAEMLLRMYLRWSGNHGFKSQILAINSGDEAGIKSVEVKIMGENAYGLLKSEKGVHRLVRISPFDSAHARHTSFALVETVPEASDGDINIAINGDELRVDTYRASGNGGQNVQKVATAVRITHIPTGLVTTCQDERSQLKNKEKALSVLRSRLLAAEIEKQQQEITDARRSQVGSGDRSERVRTYNFPQGRVTDHRIGLTSYNLEQILDGDLIEFMEALVQVEQARKLENAGM